MQKNKEKYEDKDLNLLFEDLKAEVIDYAGKKIRYYKLDAFEKLSIIASLIVFAVVVLVLVIGMLFFGLFGTAFFLGEMLNSFAAGFALLFGFLFMCLIVVVLLQKKIRRFILNKVIIIMRKIDSNEEI